MCQRLYRTGRYWSDLQPFPVLSQHRSKTKQTWQEERGEIRWLNCSLTIRPSLKRALSNPAKVAKGGGERIKRWKTRALKPLLSEREEGEGPAIDGPTWQKEQRAVHNPVQCFSAPLSGTEGRAWTMGFCPQGEGQQLQRSPPFQPICLGLPYRMPHSPRPHAQHLDTWGLLSLLLQYERERQCLPGNTAGVHKDLE